MIAWIVLALSAFLLTACEQGEPPQASSSVDNTAAGPDSARSEFPGDEAGAAMRKGPLEVVSLYARWDTANKRTNYGLDPEYDAALDSMKCFLPEEGCLSEEPGYDEAYLVRGYDVRVLNQTSEAADVEVRWDVVARRSGRLESFVGPLADTLRLRIIEGQWRLVGVENQRPPHPSVTHALTQAVSTSDSAFARTIAGTIR